MIQGEIIQSDQLNAIEHLLSRVPTTGVNQLAAEISNGNEYDVVKYTAEESVVDFKMGSLSVRLMNAKDIDMRAPSPYNHTLRARMSVSGANDVFNEPHMSTSLQQYAMTCILRDGTGQLNERDSYDEAEDDVDLENPGSKAFEKLRARAQERFWLHMTPEQRQRLHYESLQSNPQLEDILMIIKTNWDRSWNDKEDIDYFRQYAKDAKAAEHVVSIFLPDFLSFPYPTPEPFRGYFLLRQTSSASKFRQVIEKSDDNLLIYIFTVGFSG